VPPAAGRPGVVRISVGQDVTDYFLVEVRADFGRGFQVVKLDLMAPADEGEYQTNVGGGHHNTHLCTCKGFLAHGHCKHADGLAALVGRGLI
jgi:hypothetical protein